MTSTNLGLLTSFDHNLQTWKIYKCRLEQWFIANDVIKAKDPEGSKKRAILLSALSEGTYKLAADLALPKELQDVPYEDIVNILDTHFTPKQVGFSERHQFYAAIQQPTETPSQWAARLRGLTAQCRFSNVEEALRDRFIMGMLPGAEKEKLYVQGLSELTLAKAVELAESTRSARAAVSSAAAGAQAPEQLYKIVQDRNAGERRSEKVKCTVCGYNNHKAESCRFASYTCRKCNVKGHLRRMCKKVNYVASNSCEVNEGGEDDDDGELFNIRSYRGEPLVEVVCIGGKNLQFEIDSGSAVTVISENSFKLHFNNFPLVKTRKKLMSYTGEMLGCIGMARMPLQWGGRSRTLDVFVVRGGGPPLLGRDFISQFELQLSPVYYSEQGKADIGQLVHARYPDLFSGKLGCFNKYEVKLTLKENAKPIFCKARPVAFALKDKVENEIDRLVGLGVLRPIEHSEYASPIVPVLKRDGSVRMCVDYSVSINKQLVVEQYPLPTITELFSKLCGGQKFSKLDLSMAYNQFCLDKESQKFTCINTHRGLFAYTRLVFGLTSAPAIFQRAMENLLAGISGVLVLLDDVLVTGQSEGQHLDRLHQVLQRLQDAGLTLQSEKCDFFRDEISYLGYTINKDGLKKSPDKVKAILDAPIPANVTQLQSFLGLVNYYRSFVPGASCIMSPLYELLKKGNKWCWSRKEDDAFNNIKKYLASEQILAHFDVNAKLILTVDASPSGLGAILSQIDKDGYEKPISYASRTLSNAERHYSQIQKEATAIVFGVRRFHQYLYGRSMPFVLRTDHKPLLSIFGPYKGIPEVSANRLQRYALFLSAYNYNIEYIKSADNSADYLSRASLDGAAAEERGEACDRAAYVCFVVEGALPITLCELRNATSNDPVLANVKHYIHKGWPKATSDPNLRPYHLCRLELSDENGCVMRGHKVVIPASLQERVISELHTSHLGIVKTKAEARARFWFPGIDGALERMISSCDVCARLRPSPPRAPISTWKYPPRPFYRVHLDFLGPINGHMYLVIVDAYTKWVEVYEMSTSTTAAVIERMYEFMSRFGLIHTLVTDNGTSFCSQEFKNFCSLNGVSHMTSPPYHPASNGQAECYVKIVKRGIKSSLQTSNNLRHSRLKLLKYLFDYRNSIHSTTNASPAQLVFGRQLRSRLDLLARPSCSSPSLADHVQSKQCSQTEAHGGKDTKFLPNQLVLYKQYTNNNKFKWTKGVVLKEIGTMLYLIKDCVTSVSVRKHKNQLLHYNGLNDSKNRPGDSNLQTCDVSVFDDITITRPPIEESASSSQSLLTSENDDCNEGGGEIRNGMLSPTVDDVTTPGNSPSCDGVTITRGVRRPPSEDDDEFFDVDATSDEGTTNTGDVVTRTRRFPPVDYKRFF